MQDIYFNKHIDSEGDEFITIGQKVHINVLGEEREMGFICRIPSDTFYTIVERLRVSEGSPIIYAAEA